METTYRSHTCGALRLADEGATVHLCGWVNSIRDQGGVLFVDLVGVQEVAWPLARSSRARASRAQRNERLKSS